MLAGGHVRRRRVASRRHRNSSCGEARDPKTPREEKICRLNRAPGVSHLLHRLDFHRLHSVSILVKSGYIGSPFVMTLCQGRHLRGNGHHQLDRPHGGGLSSLLAAACTAQVIMLYTLAQNGGHATRFSPNCLTDGVPLPAVLPSPSWCCPQYKYLNSFRTQIVCLYFLSTTRFSGMVAWVNTTYAPEKFP